MIVLFIIGSIVLAVVGWFLGGLFSMTVFYVVLALLGIFWAVFILGSFTEDHPRIVKFINFVIVLTCAILTTTYVNVWPIVCGAVVVSLVSTINSWENAYTYQETNSVYAEDEWGVRHLIAQSSRIVEKTPVVVITSLIFYIGFPVMGWICQVAFLYYIPVIWAGLKFVVSLLTRG